MGLARKGQEMDLACASEDLNVGERSDFLGTVTATEETRLLIFRRLVSDFAHPFGKVVGKTCS